MRIHFPAMRVKQKRESNSQVCKRSRGKVRLERGLLSLCLIVYQSKGQTGLFIPLPFIGLNANTPSMMICGLILSAFFVESAYRPELGS